MDYTRPRIGVAVDYGKLRSDLCEVRDRLPDIRETAESSDGMIRATLGAKGELLDLHLDPACVPPSN